jgi:hypothetical protein
MNGSKQKQLRAMFWSQAHLLDYSITDQDECLEGLKASAGYDLVEHDVRREFGIGQGIGKMTTNFPSVMNPSDLATALGQSQVISATGGGGGNFLKMDFETGEWLLGVDSDIVTDDEVLVNTPSIAHGWVLWSAGRPKKTFVPFNQPLPPELPPIGEDYASEARSFGGALFDDETQLSFDTNSFGGRKGVDVLLGEIKAHAATGSSFLYPLVKLTSESYANKKRGGKLVFNPVFEVISWHNEDGVAEAAGPGQIEAPVEAEVEAEAEAEAPKKRQRRKSKAAA